jgi:hypothetical protein
MPCFLPAGQATSDGTRRAGVSKRYTTLESWHSIVKQFTGQLPTPSVFKSKKTFNVVALWLVLLLHSIEVTDPNRKHIFCAFL